MLLLLLLYINDKSIYSVEVCNAYWKYLKKVNPLWYVVYL